MTNAVQPTPNLIRQAARMLNEAASHWDQFNSSIGEILEVPIASGFGATNRGSDISDPTSAAALAKSRLYWSQKLSHADMEAMIVFVHAKKLLAVMSARPVLQVDPKLKRLARCAEPLCEEMSVKDGRCNTHYMQAYRAKRAAEQAKEAV